MPLVRAWRTAASSLLLQLYSIGFLVGSDLGPATFTVPRHAVTQWMIVVTCFGLWLYLADAVLWRPSKWLFGAAVLSAVVAFAIAQSEEQPAILSAIALCGLPLLALLLQQTILAGRLASDVLALLSINCGATAAWSCIGWVLWISSGNGWLTSNQIEWTSRLGCDVSQSVCRRHAFILWASGALLSAFCALLAIASGLLRAATTRMPHWAVARLGMAPSRADLVVSRPAGDAAVAARAGEAPAQTEASNASNAAAAVTTVVGAVIAVLLLGVYVASCLAGAAMQLSHAFTVFLFASLLGVVLLAGSAVGWHALLDSVAATMSPVTQLCSGLLDEEYLRAASLYAAPLFAAYLVLAALHQSVRRLRFALGCRLAGGHADGEVGAHLMGPNEEAMLLTPLASRQLESLRGWAWASILLKACTLGLLLWLLLYGSTLTYMGLSLMIAWLQPMHWAAASAIFFVFGILLFLLPPVPGLAVYLCAGVLLTPACESAFGYWGACVYSAFLAVAIKNVALVLQMKLIGEALGSSAHVRAAVDINSDTMKAIRLILSRPGLTLDKVCILCAGPDWPTGVLCGILGLQVSEMLIGLLPLFVLTVPTSLASAFQLRTSEGGMWEPIASFMLLLAALTQLVASVIALYYIERVRNTGAAACPDDVEVAQIAHEHAAARLAFVEATRLARIPPVPKAMLLSGSSSPVISRHLPSSPFIFLCACRYQRRCS